MKVRFTPTALEEHFETIKYIRQKNPKAAWEYLEHVEKILKRLELFPNSGRLLPEYPNTGYQEVIIPPNRYIYLIEGDTVWVSTVWHEKQQLGLESDKPTIPM